MKYKTFLWPLEEPIFVQGDYSVYEVNQHGRWYLVRDGKELAWKNYKTDSPDYPKWIEGWEKNAEKQLNSLQVRVNALLDERDEILTLIGE